MARSKAKNWFCNCWKRMEAWAVLVALDEAYQDALDDSSPHCTELREMVDRLVDEVELLDEELRATKTCFR